MPLKTVFLHQGKPVEERGQNKPATLETCIIYIYILCGTAYARYKSAVHDSCDTHTTVFKHAHQHIHGTISYVYSIHIHTNMYAHSAHSSRCPIACACASRSFAAAAARARAVSRLAEANLPTAAAVTFEVQLRRWDFSKRHLRAHWLSGPVISPVPCTSMLSISKRESGLWVLFKYDHFLTLNSKFWEPDEK